MPQTCAAVGCTTRWRKDSPLSFCRFPMDNIRRKLWINAVRRVSILDGSTWTPSPYDRVCGLHFVTGKASKDKNHPDYVPSLFSFTPTSKTEGSVKKLQRYDRAKRRDAVVRRALAPLNTDNCDVDDFLEGHRNTAETVLCDENSTVPSQHTDQVITCDIQNVLCEETVTTQCDDINDVPQPVLNYSLHDHNYSLVLSVDSEDILPEETGVTDIDLELPTNPASPEYVAEPFYDRLPGDDNVLVPEQMETDDVAADPEKENLQKMLNMTQTEYQRLLNENRDLKDRLQKNKFTYTNLSDSNISQYTGIPTLAVFNWVLNITTDAFSQKRSLCPGDQLLLVLMKLRLNLLNSDLANRFGVSSQLVSLLLSECLPVMAEKLKFLIKWPEKDVILRNLPKSFKKQRAYRKCTVIIDCSEVFIERPLDLTARAQTWSNYKHHNTLKFLIGITPYGTVSFLSKCWGGRVSDKEITQRSGFYDKVGHGDLVLADRGFLIGEELAVRGASLAIPAFTKGKAQLSQKDVETSRRLARYRIHVERAIRRVKIFRILSSVLSVSLLPHADDIITVCAALTNLLPRLVS